MKEIEEVEEVEEVKTTENYIPESELSESKKIMRGRTMYTINSDMEIVETKTVRCNPSSYDYNALKRFLEHDRETLESWFSVKDNSYAISYYVCGYNRTAQDDYIEGWADEGVRVFQKKEDKKGQQFHTVVFFQTKIPQAYSLSAPKKIFIHILFISTKTNNSTQKLKFLEDFYGRKEDEKVKVTTLAILP